MFSGSLQISFMKLQIGSLEERPHFKRRKVIVQDDLDQSIEMKLWGQHALNPQIMVHDKVNIACVEVDLWQRTVSVNSTPDTTLSVSIHKFSNIGPIGRLIDI